MAITTPPEITPYPEAPQRNQAESVFVPLANTFVASLEPRRVEMQALADWMKGVGDFIDSNLAAINTVSGGITNVNAVGDDIANVNTTATNIDDVNTVAGISANTTIVAGIAPDVTTVAGVSGNVTTVATDILNVNTVAPSIGSVNTVASDIASVNTVAANVADVNTVATNVADVQQAASLSQRQALYAKSLAENPPLRNETLRLDYANRAYGIGDAETGLITDIEPFDGAHTFTRASTKTALNALGKLVTYGVDEPAYTYDPVTGESLGLLIEEQRTNLLLWSEDIQASAWTGQTFPTEAVPSIIEGGTAYRFTGLDDTFRGRYQLLGNFTGVAETFTVVFEKSPTDDVVNSVIGIFSEASGVGFIGRAQLNWSTGDVTSLSGAQRVAAEKLTDSGPNGGVVYAVSVTATGNETETKRAWIYPTGTTANTETVIVHYAQFEPGSTPSSYIKTEDAQVTRAADNVSRVLGSEFNASEGTLYAEFTPKQAENFNGIGLFNANSTERIVLRYMPTLGTNPNAAQGTLSTNGVTQAVSSANNFLTLGEKVKMAVSWDLAGFYFACNGQYIGTGMLPGGLIPQPNRLSIAGSGGGNFGANTEIREVDSVRYTPRALTESELIALTTLEA